MLTMTEFINDSEYNIKDRIDSLNIKYLSLLFSGDKEIIFKIRKAERDRILGIIERFIQPNEYEFKEQLIEKIKEQI